MALRFTEQTALSLVLPHLFPAEQLLHRMRGIEKPWYSLPFWRLGSFLWRYYLVVATNQRVVFIEHRSIFGGYRSRRVQSVSWAQIDEMSLGWGIFTKTLRVRAPAAGFALSVRVGRFGLSNDLSESEGTALMWQSKGQVLGQSTEPTTVQ